MKIIRDLIIFSIPSAFALFFADTNNTAMVIIILSLVSVIMRIVDRQFVKPFYEQVQIEMIKREIKREQDRILKKKVNK